MRCKYDFKRIVAMYGLSQGKHLCKNKKRKIFIGDIYLKNYEMFVSENLLRSEVVSILDGKITIYTK